MSLKDALARHQSERMGPRCSVGILIDSLTETAPDDSEALRAAVEGEDVQVSVLYRALRDEYANRTTPSEGTLSRHRRRQCKCGER